MKKEFSFYEFTGILVPGVIFLYSLSMLIEHEFQKQYIDFSKLGESIVLLIVAYGVGHILQSVGNIFEKFFWKIYGGMPTHWLTVKPRIAKPLFDDKQTIAILTKIHSLFGVQDAKDYGRDVYNWLCVRENITEKRIDIFNANYGMFRGLTVAFYLVAIACFFLLTWEAALVPFVLGILANFRVFRFGKLYAQEVFRSFQYYELKS